MTKTVREMRSDDVDSIIDYFLNADREYLNGRGVDINKLPGKQDWKKIILTEFEKVFEYKSLYYLVWEINDTPVGHSHINDIVFGQEAFMHLHLWNSDNRQKGNGSYFVRESLPYYFENFELQNLFCQPYSLNPAPNKTLEKVGFTFIKKYETMPTPINFRQYVNLWKLSRNDFNNFSKNT